jgi:orotidine-5'-phosphate decarboxylase
MSKIIISLDNLSKEYALQIAQNTEGLVWGFKVNDLLLKYGATIIYELKNYGNVMADPKLFDIPNTIDNSIESLLTAGADIITVHCSANYQSDKYSDSIAGITVLTSFDAEDCMDVYCKSVPETVRGLTRLAARSNYGYLVCSAKDLAYFKAGGGPIGIESIKKICPGIRPSWYTKKDDQKRIVTPARAIELGADLLVIGRPITHVEDYVDVIRKINSEIAK